MTDVELDVRVTDLEESGVGFRNGKIIFSFHHKIPVRNFV